MPIALIGQINLSALNVPQAIVQIVPPQFLFNGVATNVCGLVGTSNWGPVNLAMTFGNYAQYASIFGPTINRLYDMGGHVTIAQMQGAGYFAGVRVTDGTDVAASGVSASTAAVAASDSVTYSVNPTASATVTINGSVWTYVSALTTGLQILLGATLPLTLAAAVAALNGSADANTAKSTYSTNGTTTLNMTAVAAGTAGNSYTLAASVGTVAGATFSGGAAAVVGATWTGKYTGSLGNSVTVSIQKGSAASSFKVIVSCASSLAMEVFDSIGAGLTGNAMWVAIANAINNGVSTVRPASNIIIATAGAGTGTPTIGAVTLSGGTDGVTGLTGSAATIAMLGVNTVPRTGMYALQNQGVAQFTLCDNSDITAIPTLQAFGTSIGAYVIWASPPSDTLTNAATELSSEGIDTFVVKAMFGDWLLWIDTVNGIPARMTSPAAATIGLLGNSSPQVNTLNKPIIGIWGTQSLVLGKTYSPSDFQNLALARMDVITIDLSLSNNMIHRLGINTSSNQVIMGDEYTRVVFWLAKSINVVANHYIGANMTPSEMLQAKVALQQYLALAQTNGIIYTFDGSQAYQVVLDTTNNTQATAALGYQYAYVKCVIGPIVRYFIINLEAGSSVTISATAPGL